MKIDWKKAYDLLFGIIEKDTYLNDEEFYFLLTEVNNSIIGFKDFAALKEFKKIKSKRVFYWNLINRLSEEHKFDFFTATVNYLDEKDAPNLVELQTLFNQSILIKDAKKSNPFNLFKKTESTLLLVIMFFVAMLKTLFDFVFFPKKFAKSIHITNSGEVTIVNEEYEQPLTYLLFFTILCAIYGFVATSTKFASKLLLEDKIFKPFINILANVWNYVQELNWSKLFIVMVPLVLFTVLYAASMTLSSRFLKIKPNFNLNLYVCSYYFGTYLFLHGLLFSYAMIMSSFIESMNINALFILMLIWHILIILFIVKNFHSFFVIVKLKISKSLKSAILLIILSTLLFILIFIPLGVIVFPFFMT